MGPERQIVLTSKLKTMG